MITQQHPEIKAHNEHAARTNDPMIPKSRGLLQKGVKFWKSLKTPPKEVTPTDFKKNPGKAIKTILHPRNVAQKLISRLYQPTFPKK